MFPVGELTVRQLCRCFLFDSEKAVHYTRTSCGVCFLVMFLVKAFLIYANRVYMPNLETNRQMYAMLNKTLQCSSFEVDIPGSGLNLFFWAVTAVVKYFWLLLRAFLFASWDSFSWKCPVLKEGDQICCTVSYSRCRSVMGGIPQGSGTV